MAKMKYIATRSFSGETFTYAAGDEVCADEKTTAQWLEIGFIKIYSMSDAENAMLNKAPEKAVKKLFGRKNG